MLTNSLLNIYLNLSKAYSNSNVVDRIYTHYIVHLCLRIKKCSLCKSVNSFMNHYYCPNGWMNALKIKKINETNMLNSFILHSHSFGVLESLASIPGGAFLRASLSKNYYYSVISQNIYHHYWIQYSNPLGT